jgi:flagellar biosynthesis/type III secretory pathway protein FliH
MTETRYSKFGFDNEFFELNVHGGFASSQSRTEVLDQAKAEGYAAGLAEGQKKAVAEVAELGQRLAALTAQVGEAQKQWEEATLKRLLSLWHGSLAHLLGQAAAHYPEAILEQHLKALLPLIRTSEDLTLRLHPGARHFHEKLDLAHAAIGGHNFRIIDDLALAPSDCVVEWHGGGLEAKLADHQKLIAALLAGAGGDPHAVPPPEPAAAPAPAAPAAPAADPAKARAAELLGDDELVDALK